jgi:hypothetical protein
MLIRRLYIWSVKRIKLAALLLVALSLHNKLYAQGDKSSLVPLKVKKGSYVYLYDSLYYFNHDTILYLSNSLLPDSPEDIEKTRVFYDSLRAKASRNNITKRLYDLAIVLPPNANNQDRKAIINSDYSESVGKTIRNITIKRLDPFGTNINDPNLNKASGFSAFLNNTHATTKEFVIRSYLLFREGDKISSFNVSESERLIRRLKYIDDARIILIPVSDDMVDIHIVTRDMYSLGLYYEIRGTKAGTVDLFERSLLGLGHEFEVSFPYDYYVDYYGFGYQLSYMARNISRSLIDATATYSNALGKEYYELNIQRKFLTAATKYAGGFKIREEFTGNDLDTLDSRETVEYNKVDLWMGTSIRLDKSNLSRLVLSARYVNNNVYERPEISSTSYYSLQKYKLLLGSITLVKQEYFKTNLIYNFGRTEDLPYGSQLSITAGKEINEFKERNYYGLSASLANRPNELGYFYAGASFGIYGHDDIKEQGALDLEFDYISNLISLGKYRIRHFSSLRYTRGYNRFDDEYLRIGESTGIRGFSNDTIRPDQRLIFNYELVSFSPIYIYGFRFAFYGYTDIGVFKNGDSFKLNSNAVSEIGLGLRIRNDNLIFKTIQLRFSYFPLSPPYSTTKYLDIKGEKLYESKNFDPAAPKIITYR